MSIATLTEDFRVILPIPSCELFSLNGIYLMKYLNELIHGKDDTAFFEVISDFEEYGGSKILRMMFDSQLIKKTGLKDIKSKDIYFDLQKICEKKTNFSKEDIKVYLKKLINDKYHPLIEERKKVSILNSFEVISSIFNQIGSDYYSQIKLAVEKLLIKIDQLYNWTFPEEFKKEAELAQFQLKCMSLFMMFNCFDTNVLIDQNRELMNLFDLENFHSRWAKYIGSIINDLDYLDYEKTINPISEIIFESLFHDGKDYTHLFKKIRGGQKSSNEAGFHYLIYDYLRSLKNDKNIEIVNTKIYDDEPREYFTYSCSRDEWVNSLRSNLVQLITVFNRFRDISIPLKEFESNETIRTMVMRHKKNISENFDL